MKISSSARRCVNSRKWVKLTQDELFSIFKSEHFLRVYSCALIDVKKRNIFTWKNWFSDYLHNNVIINNNEDFWGKNEQIIDDTLPLSENQVLSNDFNNV